MKLRSTIIFLIFSISVLVTESLAQEDIQIGSNLKNFRQTQGGYFDYSDPGGVNIKVQLWGYIKYPGYYIVPATSSVNDLISLAGGPLEDANLDDVRILKLENGASKELIKYNYNDLVWEDSLKTKIYFPRLTAGDIVVVPGEPRYFVREDITFYLYLITALTSTTALIISITK